VFQNLKKNKENWKSKTEVAKLPFVKKRFLKNCDGCLKITESSNMTTKIVKSKKITITQYEKNVLIKIRLNTDKNFLKYFKMYV